MSKAGDKPGHVFHGNQYTAGSAMSDSEMNDHLVAAHHQGNNPSQLGVVSLGEKVNLHNMLHAQATSAAATGGKQAKVPHAHEESPTPTTTSPSPSSPSAADLPEDLHQRLTQAMDKKDTGGIINVILDATHRAANAALAIHEKTHAVDEKLHHAIVNDTQTIKADVTDLWNQANEAQDDTARFTLKSHVAVIGLGCAVTAVATALATGVPFSIPLMAPIIASAVPAVVQEISDWRYAHGHGYERHHAPSEKSPEAQAEGSSSPSTQSPPKKE